GTGGRDGGPDGLPDAPPDGKRVVGIAVAPSQATLGIGGVASFTATLTYSDGTTSDATATAFWTSANNRVATVMGGRVTALGVGTGQITAASGGFSSSATVRVVQAVTLVSIAIDPPFVTLPIAARQPFTVTGFFSDGTTSDITAMAKWTTD